jgi:hypothetical protein
MGKKPLKPEWTQANAYHEYGPSGQGEIPDRQRRAILSSSKEWTTDLVKFQG